MRKLLRRWLLSGTEELDRYEEIRAANHVLERSTPAIQAYRIANGYVVQVINNRAPLEGTRAELPVYCKDHGDIANYIITRTATEKLLGEQMELPF